MISSFRTKYLLPVRIFLAVFYIVGILGFLFPGLRPLFQQLVSLNLIISAILLFLFHIHWSKKHLLLFLATAIFGFTVEMVGIHTGIIFGNYEYGNVLGLKVLQTPLLIGINWLVLVYCVWLLFPKINNQWYYPFLGAAILVIFDFFMEPVAIKTGMWSWENNQVPLKNYIDWYIVAFIILMIFRIVKIKYTNQIAVWLLAVQFIFFVILNQFLK